MTKQSIWLEVWLPENTPHDIINNLIGHGFGQTPDGGGQFYIPEALLESFKSLARPHNIYILQRFPHRDIPLETRQNMVLDMMNVLNEAGVAGVDNFVKKVSPTIEGVLP